MNRHRFLVAMVATVLGATVAGCSGANPNEKGFETEGRIDPNIPVDAEGYEKKFQKRAAPRTKGGKPVPTEI